MYRNPLIPRNTEKVRDLVLQILCILAVSALMMWLMFRPLPPPPHENQRLVRPEVKADIIHRLVDRNLPLNVTVEITPAGYRYEWQGKWYRLK